MGEAQTQRELDYFVLSIFYSEYFVASVKALISLSIEECIFEHGFLSGR